LKIIFLIGSLEPGRDGVGDYVTRLGGELTRKGHNIAVLALNDQHTEKEREDEYKQEGYTGFRYLRVPSIWPSEKRYRISKEWIKKFNPDWISLQFVIFAFHPKGLPFGLARKLCALGQGRSWHIMFHELWVGMDANATKKNILWGWFQRKIIKNVIRDINPVLIHTQSRLYQSQLDRIGFPNGYLPLFGNIPNVNGTHNPHELPVSDPGTDKIFRLVHFAMIHRGAPVNEFAKDLAKYSRELNLQVCITLVGRSGSEAENWQIAFQNEGLPVEVLGEKSTSCISKIFNQSDLGISSTPISLVEKSGSIAAMREHGLPILCVSLPWKIPAKGSFTPTSGIFEFRDDVLKELLSARKKYAAISNVYSVATRLDYCFSSYLTN
jgi:hypothetical protein